MRTEKEIKNELRLLRREFNNYKKSKEWDLTNQVQLQIDQLIWVLENKEEDGE